MTQREGISPWYRRMVKPWSIDCALLLLRLWFGCVMAFAHGSGKVFGDPAKLIESVEKMGFPMPEFFAWAAALAEFLGGLLLILGLGTRAAAIWIAITMAVAGFITHAADPFKVKELALSYLVIAIVIAIAGPGKWNADRMIFSKRD
ncbi:MAG: DoxX family protein [Bacteroidota bacterium]